jgi:hypothetical protein
VNVGVSAPAPGSSTANYVNNGSAFCSECDAYQPQIDNNPCSATYGQTQNVPLGEAAPCDYSAAWVNRDINTYYVCVGVDKHYEQINTNPCYTGAQTQTGSLYQANSTDCGYVALNVTGFSASATDTGFGWDVTIGIVLDGAVNTNTTIDATIFVNGGEQTYGVIISNGNSSGVATIGYIDEPTGVGPKCLTFMSGDSRVNTGAVYPSGYTCP